MLKGFRQFVLRGNALDLAVGVVIGAAFGAVVTALVKDVLTPFIAAAVESPDFSALVLPLHGSRILIGDFINALFSFVLMPRPSTFRGAADERAQRAGAPRRRPPDPTTKKCPECLSEIPIAARRCAFCTSQLA